MAERQLIIAVEGTAALGPFWRMIATDYLEKIIRSFAGNEVPGQKTSSQNVELALVMFNAHGSYSGCLVQRTGWTKVVDTFLQWLYAIPFGGGGFNNVAVTEGLSEALMMFSPLPPGGQTQQSVDGNKHCILVAASDPYLLPTPVFRPQLQSAEKIENTGQPESRLSDAEAVAKSYSLCSISLSVICPKQLPKLRAIYNAGKRNPHAADTPVDAVKSTHHLVLVSDNFKEARAALSLPGTTNLMASQTPVKVDTAEIPHVTGLSTTSASTVNGMNGSISNRQQITVPNIPATVKVEPNTGHMAPAPFPTMPNVMRPTVPQTVSSLQNPSIPVSQVMNGSGDGVQEVKPVVSGMSLPMRPTGLANVKILNDISQARQVMNSASLTGASSIGLPSMGQTPVAMHMSNMISSGMASSIPTGQNVFSAGQPGITTMEGLGSMAGSAPIIQNNASGSINSVASNASGNANPGVSQPLGSNLQGSVGQLVSGINQGNVSSPQMGQNGISLNQTNGLGSSTVPPGGGQMMPNPNMPQLAQSSMYNNLAANMPLTQQTSNALQPAQSKYVKVWEGDLSGQRQGQPVFITRLEGYRSASASEKLAENWPKTMQIVRLISQDHMNNKQYVGKADFLVFRAMNSHGFLGQLQEKKLCAVIQLTSQTLLLSVSDKACRLIGMLFPGDMVVFKQPQMPTQQQQQLQQLQQLQQNPQLQQLQQNPQLQQLQQQQQNNQLQQQQQQQQQQQHGVGTAMNQGFGQGSAQSQIAPPQGQQQVTAQVAHNMQGPGAGFMS